MNFAWNLRGLALCAGIVVFASLFEASGQSLSTTVGGITTSPTRASPAGINWNPAVIGTYSGTQLESNVSLMGGWLIYDRDGTNAHTGQEFDSVSMSLIAPNPFLSVSSDFGSEHFRFGYATYFPSGAIARYPEDGAQRYDLIDGLIVPWHHQFTFAYTPSSKWSFAVSGIYSMAFLKASLDIDLAPTLSSLLGPTTELQSEDPTLSSRANIPLTRAHAFTLGFGALYRPSIQWSFGASFYLPTSYWFKQKLNLDMPSIVTALAAAPEALGLSENVSNEIEIHSELPAHLNLGFRYQPYGYWAGEYFGRYVFASRTQYTSIYFRDSSIEKLKRLEIKGPSGKDTFSVGSIQNFSFWPRFHFGIAGSYTKNGVDDHHVSASRVDFDSVMVGLFTRYRLTHSMRLGVEYAHSFLFDRYITESRQDSDLDLFKKPSSVGRYRASVDRLGVNLGYDF